MQQRRSLRGMRAVTKRTQQGCAANRLHEPYTTINCDPPDWLKRMALTAERWPRSVTVQVPVVLSHSRT